MYPFCKDPRRLEIIAVLMVMLFLFDDKCEVAEENQLPTLISDFLARLGNPEVTQEFTGQPLQAYLDTIIEDIRASDAQRGNGGIEVYAEMRKTFTYLRPSNPIGSIDESLQFRLQNVWAGFVFACVKFSLASDVDIHQPNIQSFKTWAAEHLAITNDLYSYEKEECAYRDGACPDLINIVAVLRRSSSAGRVRISRDGIRSDTATRTLDVNWRN